jgi:hypothetical protein
MSCLGNEIAPNALVSGQQYAIICPDTWGKPEDTIYATYQRNSDFTDIYEMCKYLRPNLEHGTNVLQKQGVFYYYGDKKIIWKMGDKQKADFAAYDNLFTYTKKIPLYLFDDFDPANCKLLPNKMGKYSFWFSGDWFNPDDYLFYELRTKFKNAAVNDDTDED